MRTMPTATIAYQDALEQAPDIVETGLKASVEAIKDGDMELAAILLEATAEHCEEASEQDN